MNSRRPGTSVGGSPSATRTGSRLAKEIASRSRRSGFRKGVSRRSTWWRCPLLPGVSTSSLYGRNASSAAASKRPIPRSAMSQVRTYGDWSFETMHSCQMAGQALGGAGNRFPSPRTRRFRIVYAGCEPNETVSSSPAGLRAAQSIWGGLMRRSAVRACPAFSPTARPHDRQASFTPGRSGDTANRARVLIRPPGDWT